MTNKIFIIANWFIDRGLKENNPITKIKLQKLLYFSFGYYYVEYKSFLFENDFWAWKYGPVIQEIYDATKSIQDYYIKDKIADFEIAQLDEQTVDILKKIWNTYKSKKDFDLVDETHRKESPWYDSTPNTKIGKLSIGNYFQAIDSIFKNHSTVFYTLAKE